MCTLSHRFQRRFGVGLGGSLLAVLLAGTSCPPDIPSDPVTGVELTSIAQGLTSPVDLAAPEDTTGRLFIVDQVGTVRIISPEGELRESPFLDLSDRMVELNENFDERGLLSLAFHPDYAQNGRFFVVYNAPLIEGDSDEFDSRWRLSEFTVSEIPDQAQADSEVILLELLKPQFNHNGGQLAFGPNGRLYASVGDGGGAHDVGFGHTPDIGNGQDTTNLLGSILRLDVDTPGELNIPPDNPFVGDDDVLDEIFAYGFRNPWRFSFDMGGQRRLFCADAGQNLFEEVSIVEAGGNYGWNIREGSHCFDPDDPDTPAASCPDAGPLGNPLIDPVIEYSRLDDEGNVVRLVVVGGHVYRGQSVPALTGRYIFGDWSSSFSVPDGSVFIATENEARQWSFREVEIATSSDGRLNRFLLAFGQDHDGEVYLLTSGNTGPTGTTGEVLKIVSALGE